MHRTAGWTLVEISIYSVIGLLLTGSAYVYLFQSQKLFHRTSHAGEMLASKIDAFAFITRDLSSAKRIAMGSLLLNGDFETVQSPTTPASWNMTPIGNGTAAYINNWSTNTSHNGLYAVALQKTSGAELSIASSQLMTLVPGNKYMISAWVRIQGGGGSRATIELADSASISWASDSTTLGGWQQIKFPYPAGSAYTNNLLTANQAKIILTVSQGPDLVYFDDIAVTPIQAVLASPNANEVNVIKTVSNAADSGECTGFRFVRWEKDQAVLYRYRIISKPEETYVLRERYDTAASLWKDSGTNKIGVGVSTFRIEYDNAGVVPFNGKETPFTITFAVQDDYMRRQNMQPRADSMTIFPIGS